MIASERDRLWFEETGTRDISHEHKWRGGPPPLRLRRLQIAHETRARRMGVPWDMVDLRDVYKKTDGKCGICGDPVGLDDFTVDHITPLSVGGPHLLDNLQPAHRACNSRKTKWDGSRKRKG